MTATPLTPLSSPVGPAAASAPTSTRFTPLDPIRILRQYTRLLIFTAVIGFVVGVAVYLVLKQYAPEYSSTATLVVSGSVGVSTDPTTGGAPRASAEYLQTLIQNQLVLLEGDDVLEEALASSEVQRTAWYNSLKNDPIALKKDMRERLKVSNPPRTTLIFVAFEGKNPDDLQPIVDTIINVYIRRYVFGINSNTEKVRRVWFEEQQRATEELARIQEDLRTFAINNDLLNMDPNRNDTVIAYTEVALARSRMQPAYEESKQAYESALEAQKAGRFVPTPEQMQEIERAPSVQSRDERLRSLREQREVLLNRFAPNHRSIQDVDQTIIATEQERQREVDRLLRENQATKVAAAKAQYDIAESQMKSLQFKLDELRKKTAEIAQKFQDYENKKASLAVVAQRKDNATMQLQEIDMRRRRPDFQGVDYALRPTSPEMTYPKFASIATGSTILFLGLALLVVFTKELLDQRIKSPADVRLLPNAELLGIVPESAEDPLGPARIETAVRTDPSGLIAESFRQIRTGILARADRRGYKTLMLVCAQGGCGSSTIASNLALSMAYNGKRVLVLEVNFRRPIQHSIFETAAKPGLIEVLRGTAKLEDAIVHKNEPRLDVLPVGDSKDAPPELLDSPAFRQLLTQLESRYDIILIDAPPALITSESQHLARHVDAVVIVIRALKDQRGTVSRMMRQFEGQRADVLGIILNGVRSSAGGYFRKNYEEFYRYREAVRPTGTKAVLTRKAPAVKHGDGD